MWGGMVFLHDQIFSTPRSNIQFFADLLKQTIISYWSNTKQFFPPFMSHHFKFLCSCLFAISKGLALFGNIHFVTAIFL